MTVTRNGGVGTLTNLRIRGAEAEQTLVLIDGVRINDPSSPGGGFDFGNLLADNIQRIEVLRGPNSVPWGSQAIGGVVNIVSAQPTLVPSFSARAEGGSFGTGQVVGKIDVDEANQGTDLVFSPDGEAAFVVDQFFNSLHIFNSRRGQNGDPTTLFAGPSRFGPGGTTPPSRGAR